MTDFNELFESGNAKAHNQEDQWIGLSDLMTSMMLIFMLIAIAFMLKTQADTYELMKNTKQMQEDAAKMEAAASKIKEIAVIYDQVKNNIYQELNKEFDKDFQAWGATLDKDLTIRFDNEYVMFDRGKDEVKYSFQAVLRNFFPRYLKIITSPHYKDTIQEVRIEGHTSRMWSSGVSPEEGYFKNMELSQARTRSTLRFVMELPEAQKDLSWLRKYVTANGLSSARPVLNPDGSENEALSQRVEFRIRTDAEARINSILQSDAQRLEQQQPPTVP